MASLRRPFWISWHKILPKNQARVVTDRIDDNASITVNGTTPAIFSVYAQHEKTSPHTRRFPVRLSRVQIPGTKPRLLYKSRGWSVARNAKIFPRNPVCRRSATDNGGSDNGNSAAAAAATTPIPRRGVRRRFPAKHV